MEGYERIFEAAPEMSRFAVCSGDVLVQFEEPLPPLPEADVVIVGLWVQPHEATHFGVQFCPRSRPTELAYCLQKPSVDEIREEIRDGNLFMIDSGMWLFSERAAKALAEKCGWDEQSQEFSGGRPNNYELYHEFALGLGTSPTQPDPALAGLTCAVYALPAGQFYHFGTSREMIESSERLQNLIVDQRLTPMNPGKSHPDMFIQNAIVKYRLNDENHALWIENAHIGQRWKLSHAHVLTGIPKNDWQVSLPPGCCLDMLPIGEASICIRPYGIDDPFRGDVDSPSTLWQGAPAEVWFERRGIDLQAAGLAGVDLQQAPLFPVLQQEEATGPFVEWLIATHPADSPEFRAQWEQAERLSAEALGDRANLTRLKEQRTQFRRDALPILARHHERSVFYRLDLDATARDYAAARTRDSRTPGRAARASYDYGHAQSECRDVPLCSVTNPQRCSVEERGRDRLYDVACDRAGCVFCGPRRADAYSQERPDRVGAEPDPAGSGWRLDRHAAVLPDEGRSGRESRCRSKRPSTDPSLRAGQRP